MPLSSSLARAAVVVNSLSTDYAARVLSRLEPEEIQSVLGAISNLKKLPRSEVMDSINRFSKEAGSEIDLRKQPGSSGSTTRESETADALNYHSVSTACESELPFAFLEMKPLRLLFLTIVYNV